MSWPQAIPCQLKGGELSYEALPEEMQLHLVLKSGSYSVQLQGLVRDSSFKFSWCLFPQPFT